MQVKFTVLFFVVLITLTGCAQTALQTANNQANAANKATPINIDVNVPFDSTQAKAALAKGNSRISGVLYHRLDITGRDETGWPQSPLIKNHLFNNAKIYLYPETAPIVAYDKLFSEQQSKMRSWYLNPPSAFNKQPQAKRFVLPEGVTDIAITVKTDDYGRYSFDNIKPGRYYLYTTGWQTGSYNKEVYAGSSEYSDGTGVYGERGTVDHKKLVPVNYKTYLVYSAFVNVGTQPVAVDSRFKVDYNEMSIAYDK